MRLCICLLAALLLGLPLAAQTTTAPPLGAAARAYTAGSST